MAHRDDRPPKRLNLTVPQADESVLSWLELQENKSISIRTVIRHFISQHGYVDPLCLPIDQQPKRGRPPTQTSSVSHSTSPAAQSSEDDKKSSTQETPVENENLQSEQTPEISQETSSSEVSDDVVYGDDGMADVNALFRR